MNHQATAITSADLALIQRMIPHRYPFLLVDKVRDIVPFVSCVGIKNVTCNEPQFQGHFPGNPIFPGVQVLEAMAQTAAVLASASMHLVDRRMLVYFMSMEHVKFRRMVVPGDVLELHITVKRGGGKVWKVDGRAVVDGQTATEGELTAMMDILKD